MQYRVGNIPFISWMSNHFYVYGGAGFTSMEAKEYNFGSVKPGTLHPHIPQKYFTNSSLARLFDKN